MGGASDWAKCGLLTVLAAFDSVRPGRDILPVLNYHAVDGDPSPTSLPPELFRMQMDILAIRGWRAVTFGEAVEILARHGPLPRRTAALTFDDGMETVFTAAFPVLKERGFKATVFLTTGTEGNRVSWERDDSIKARPLMSKDQVRALHEAGFEIGGHTRTHPHLTECDDPALESEIAGNRDDVASITGSPPRTFAYPYGDHDDRVVEAVRRAGYAGACTITLPGRKMRRDPYRVERFDVSRFSGHRGRLAKLSFRSSLTGVFADYVHIKRVIPFLNTRTFEYAESERRRRKETGGSKHASSV